MTGDVRQSDFRMTAQIAAHTSITAGAWRWEISRLRFASLEMTGREEVSAVRYRLTVSGCWLLAIGFQLLAFGYRRAFGNPPSPLRGPLPPDKQWGAREYIGARHPVSFGVGRSNGVRAFANSKREFPFEVAKGLPSFERKQTQSSPAGG